MKKSKLLWLTLAAIVLTAALFAMSVVTYADTDKNGKFNGSPAHTDKSGNLYIDAANFPDELFRTYVSDSFDANGDGVLSLAEARGVKEINCTYIFIKSLDGIEFFTSAERIECSFCYYLTDADFSKNTALTYLDCSLNDYLTSLDLSNNKKLETLECRNVGEVPDLSKNTALTYLDCGGSSRVTSLDLSKNTELTYLNIGYTGIAGLDLSNNKKLEALDCMSVAGMPDFSKNTALTHLNCSHNGLTSLDLSKNTKLETLSATNNELTSLDLSKNTALTELDLMSNSITSLDLSKNTKLKSVNLNYNKTLTSLDVSRCTSLEVLTAKGGALTAIDVTKNTKLRELNVAENKLTGIDVSKCASLEALNAKYNMITSFDLSKNAKLMIWSTEISNQTSPKPVMVTLKNGKYTADLSSIAGKANIGKITYVCDSENSGNEASYDPKTGVVSFEKFPSAIGYSYDVDTPEFTASSYVNVLTDLAGEGNRAELTAKYFPDAAFRAYIAENFDIDGDGVLSYGELFSVTDINCTYAGIADVTGIGYFPNLEVLIIDHNNISKLDLSKNTALISLSCGYNQLKSLDVSPFTSLQYLTCYNNSLTKLDLSKNRALLSLDFENNLISSIDVSVCPELETLYCRGNALLKLDLGENKKLSRLYNVSEETAVSTVTITKKSKTKFTADLSTVVGKSGISNIKSIESSVGGKYDPKTGIAEFTDYPTEIVYVYDTGVAGRDVTLRVTIKTELVGDYVKIDRATFPDNIFRGYVSDVLDIDSDGRLSAYEIYKATDITVRNMGISDLTGVEVFDNLKKLDCSYNDLAALDVSENDKLETLWCFNNNRLTSVETSTSGALMPAYWYFVTLDDDREITSDSDFRDKTVMLVFYNPIGICLNSIQLLSELPGSALNDDDDVQIIAVPTNSYLVYDFRDAFIGYDSNILCVDYQPGMFYNYSTPLLGKEEGEGIGTAYCVIIKDGLVRFIWESCKSPDECETRLNMLKSDGLPGDADYDGKITNSDALLIFRYIFNPDKYPLNAAVIDTDGDGKLTNADALKVFRNIFNPGKYPL